MTAEEKELLEKYLFERHGPDTIDITRLPGETNDELRKRINDTGFFEKRLP